MEYGIFEEFRGQLPLGIIGPLGDSNPTILGLGTGVCCHRGGVSIMFSEAAVLGDGFTRDGPAHAA